jgi:hypothetical protein
MSVSRDCCVLSGTGLCVGLITRPEESYRLWCVSECDREASTIRRPWHITACYAIGTKLYNALQYIHCVCTYVLHKTSCIYTRYSKWVVSNHGGSTEATARAQGRVSHVF